MKLVIFS